MIAILKLLEKLFCLSVLVPPLYMAYRFIKWYFTKNREIEEELGE